MNDSVCSQGRNQAEGFAAVRTTEWLFSHVGVEVFHQCEMPSKTLPTHMTTVIPICSLDWSVKGLLVRALGSSSKL